MIFFLPLLPLLSLTLPCDAMSAHCPGCPEAAPVNHNIVAFALNELGEREGEIGCEVCCKLTVIAVENFQIQIVAGVMYRFDMVVKQGNYCERTGSTESCSVKVWEKSWEQFIDAEKLDCHTILN
eukprot:GFUD01018172.1.p1 GENE.GFUD01018172.1~~GFUD01018172.1.p1  ORF type:complete len:125 (+),score=29.54 GFUD01018172.1:73-447(+)